MTCGHFDWDKIKHNNFIGSGMIWSQNHMTVISVSSVCLYCMLGKRDGSSKGVYPNE